MLPLNRHNCVLITTGFVRARIFNGLGMASKTLGIMQRQGVRAAKDDQVPT